jgi:hypothetical protein
MQRLLASARALASDGSSASIVEPLHEAEEEHSTIRNNFGSEGYGLKNPVSSNASKILAPQTSSAVQSVHALSSSLPVSEIKAKLKAYLGLDLFALTAYLYIC